jgi:hypothetical protein
VPLLRVVSVPEGLLHPDEAARIERLRGVDPDDVPSATLALLLEAFYLSKDRRAVHAVYGHDHDFVEHVRWLQVLVACGDAGQLGELLYTTTLVGGLAGHGLARAARRLVTDAPWLGIPLALALGYLLARWTPEHTRKLRNDLSATLRVLSDVAVEQTQAHRRSLAAAPLVPAWDALAEQVNPSLVLTRACAHLLARPPRGHQSARELATALPPLRVACGETKVRGVLRSHDCFNEVFFGRYQLGAVVGATTVS